MDPPPPAAPTLGVAVADSLPPPEGPPGVPAGKDAAAVVLADGVTLRVSEGDGVCDGGASPTTMDVATTPTDPAETPQAWTAGDWRKAAPVTAAPDARRRNERTCGGGQEGGGWLARG